MYDNEDLMDLVIEQNLCLWNRLLFDNFKDRLLIKSVSNYGWNLCLKRYDFMPKNYAYQ